MTGRLEGKRALIAGAGQGIGRAIAIAYAREGATVIAASRTGAKMTDLPQISEKIAPVVVDLTNGSAVQQIVVDVGRQHPWHRFEVVI